MRNYTNRVFGYRLIELERAAWISGGLFSRNIVHGYEFGKQLGLFRSFDAALSAFEKTTGDTILIFDTFGSGAVEIRTRIEGEIGRPIYNLVLETDGGIYSERTGLASEKIFRQLDDSIRRGTFVQLSGIDQVGGRRKLRKIMSAMDRQGKPAFWRITRY